jgi:hypothetical protein
MVGTKRKGRKGLKKKTIFLPIEFKVLPPNEVRARFRECRQRAYR